MAPLDQRMIIGRRDVHPAVLDRHLVFHFADRERRALLEQHPQHVVRILVPVLHQHHRHAEVVGKSRHHEPEHRQPAPRRADHGDVVADARLGGHFTFRYSFSVELSFS